jgi:hypothetical protein
VCLNDVETEQEYLCGVSISSSKLHTNAPSNFLYAVRVLFSFDIFLNYKLPNSPTWQEYIQFPSYSFLKGGGGLQFNKNVPDVLESGLTAAVSYTKIQ